MFDSQLSYRHCRRELSASNFGRDTDFPDCDPPPPFVLQTNVGFPHTAQQFVANHSTLRGLQLTLLVLPVYAHRHKINMRVGILGMNLQVRLKV
jgi:hypothetical protein